MLNSQDNDNNFRDWHYSNYGDYHRNLDLNWSYAPTYLRKREIIASFLSSLTNKNVKILDAACGEGVFVEELCIQGWDIRGIDLNYSSRFVEMGDVRNLPYDNNSFDVVFFLDALEHLPFADQPIALGEIFRVLKPQGKLLLAVPNLAHLNSRFKFFFSGRLDRTDSELDHIGERPIWENKDLIQKAGFKILSYTGVTFTVPVIYRRIICRQAQKFRWLHDLLEPISQLFPSLAMLTFFSCEKPINDVLT